MPTGYTADVGDGKVTDFKTFALRCARNFGATIMQRDERMEVLPELRKESKYYAESVEKAQARIAELAVMSPSHADKEADRAYQTALQTNAKYSEERRVTRERYEAMLAEVVLWEPPSRDHIGLKTFMEQQLNESIKFDTDYEPDKPLRLAPSEWLADEKKKAQRDLAYATKFLAEERERVANANEWITTLYESLGEKVPA